MNEEVKYPAQGTVTISTEEYRDLIEKSIKLKCESDDYLNKYWAEQTKNNTLTKEWERANALNRRLLKFIQSDAERAAAYMKFQMEEENNNGD